MHELVSSWKVGVAAANDPSGAVRITAELEPEADPSDVEHEETLLLDYQHRLRLRVLDASGAAVATSCGGADSETADGDSLLDHLPFANVWAAPAAGPWRVRVELDVALYPRGEKTVEFRWRGAVEANVTAGAKLDLRLGAVDRLDGPPFVAPTWTEAAWTAGPKLVGKLSRSGREPVAVPGVGILRGDELLGPEGLRRVDLPTEGLSWDVVVGPGGRVAVWWEQGGAQKLDVVTLLAGGPRLPVAGQVAHSGLGAFDPAGSTLLFRRRDGMALLDLATGRVTPRAWFADGNLGVTCAVAWRGNVVTTVSQRGELKEHLRTQDDPRRVATVPVDVGSQYDPVAYDDATGRVAWTRRIGELDGEASVVGWWAPGGSSQEVVVPDPRLQWLYTLPDGRLLAVGKHPWLVSPAGRVERVGVEVDGRPALTTDGSRPRLWLAGGDPWYVDLSSGA